MPKYIALTVAILLFGCGKSEQQTEVPSTVEVGSVPFAPKNDPIYAKRKLENHLGVLRGGLFVWNGQRIDDEGLVNYLDLVSQMEEIPGIVLSIEPGVTKSCSTWVRGRIIKAGICRDRGCAESRWNKDFGAADNVLVPKIDDNFVSGSTCWGPR